MSGLVDLLERLRSTGVWRGAYEGRRLGQSYRRNPDGPEAADYITRLEAEAADLRLHRDDLLATNNRYLERARKAEADNARLREALWSISRLPWKGQFPEALRIADAALQSEDQST
jgi:hypothetical protein